MYLSELSPREMLPAMRLDGRTDVRKATKRRETESLCTVLMVEWWSERQAEIDGMSLKSAKSAYS